MGGGGSTQQNGADHPNPEHYIANAHEESIIVSVAPYDKENRRGTMATATSLKEQSTKGLGLISKSAFDKTEKEDVYEVSRFDQNYLVVCPHDVARFGAGKGDFISVKLQYSAMMIAENYKLVPGQSIIVTPEGGLVPSKYGHTSDDLQNLWIGKMDQTNYKEKFKESRPACGHHVCNAYTEPILIAYKSHGPEFQNTTAPDHNGKELSVWKPGSSTDSASFVTVPPGTMSAIGTGKGDTMSIKSDSGVIMGNITLQSGASVIITPEGGMARSKYVPGGTKSDLWLDEFTAKDYKNEYKESGKMCHYIANACKVPVSVSVISYDETDDLTQRGASGNINPPANRPADSVSQYSGADTISIATVGGIAGNMVTVAPREYLRFSTGKGDKLFVQYKKEKSYIAYNFKLDVGDSVIVTPQGGLEHSRFHTGEDFRDLWTNDEGKNYKEN